MSEVVNFPGKESVMEQKPQTPPEVALERLYALERAIEELEKVPLATLANTRFERKDGARVGLNWCLQQYGARLSKLQTRVELEGDRRRKPGTRTPEQLEQTN